MRRRRATVQYLKWSDLRRVTKNMCLQKTCCAEGGRGAAPPRVATIAVVCVSPHLMACATGARPWPCCPVSSRDTLALSKPLLQTSWASLLSRTACAMHVRCSGHGRKHGQASVRNRDALEARCNREMHAGCILDDALEALDGRDPPPPSCLAPHANLELLASYSPGVTYLLT